MGFLRRFRKAATRAVGGFLVGGPAGALAAGATSLLQSGGSRRPRLTKAPLGLQQGVSRGLQAPPNMGVPPPAIPQFPGINFPDIPGIPDLGDVQQILRGQNPFTATGPPARMSNGLASNVSQLMGSNQIVMEPGQKVIADAPPGFVIVDMPDGSKKAVLKEVARKLGLWKARAKPPISASDWKKLKAADRVKKKAKKIAQTADWKCVKK